MVTTPSMIEWQGFPNLAKSFFSLEAFKAKFLSSVYPCMRARCSPKCCKDILLRRRFPSKIYVFSLYFHKHQVFGPSVPKFNRVSNVTTNCDASRYVVFRFLANITRNLHCSIGAKVKFNGLLRHICYATFSYWKVYSGPIKYEIIYRNIRLAITYFLFGKNK